jgi:RHS repeat-associated protein
MKQVVSQNPVVQTKVEEIKTFYAVNKDQTACDICLTAACASADSLINETIDQIAALDCDNLYEQILASFRDQHAEEEDLYEPTEDEIKGHELYCRYKLCIEDQQSDAFEKKFARPADWDAAASLAYTSVPLLLYSLDPFFFIPELNGYSKKSKMEGRLNDVNVAIIEGVTYDGTINDVVDPSNTDMFVNSEGNHDPINGTHILYIDLASKLANGELTQAAYDVEVNRQRWTFFKSFYLEAKRETKLKDIAAYYECPAAKAELDREDGLKEIDTPEKIQAWGEANNAFDSVSNIEVATSFGSIKTSCQAKIEAADSLTIAGHLKEYFNSDRKNILRQIFRHKLSSDSHLLAIQQILTSKYHCGLDSVAQDDPLLNCLTTKTVVINREIQSGVPPKEPAIAGVQQFNVTNQEVQAKSLRTATESDVTTNEKEAALTIERREKEIDYNALKIKSLINTDNGAAINAKQTQNKAQARTATLEAAAPLPSLAEYNALVDLYNSTRGQNWISTRANDRVWNVVGGIKAVEGWFGITVDPETGGVTEIDLRGNSLTGPMPESIGNLINLRHLRLGKRDTGGGGAVFNGISGTIPTTIGLLQELITLDLDYAQGLTGDIPAEIGNLSNLVTLDLNRNRLSGTVPPALFTNLHNLEFLNLSYSNNLLTCNFPTSLAGVDKLKYLNLNGVELIGSIPVSIGQLADLEYLYLSSGFTSPTNKLTGSIPAMINDLDKLKVVEIHGQNLTGNIPDIGDLHDLEILDLGSNALTGSIPSRIGNLHELTTLYLNDNNLIGSIPNTNGLNNLQFLHLSNNQLSGQLPDSFSELENIISITLNNNQLTGDLDFLTGNLIRLQSLNVSNNRLSGTMPESISHLSNLYSLSLTNNQMSGSFSTANLYSLDMGSNKFTFKDIPLMHDWNCGGESGTSFCLSYSPQDSVDYRKTTSVNAGATLTLTTSIDRTVTPSCRYQWFKYVDGVNDTPVNTESATGHTVVINNVSAADAGKYYYTIRFHEYDPEIFDMPDWQFDENYNALTLTSRLQTLKIEPGGPSTTYNICMAYDENNDFVKTWTFVPNWNELIERCKANAAKEDSLLIEFAIERLMEEEITEFNSAYRTQCLKGVNEKLLYTYVPKEYHYTLYYFDQGANLIQTVPPKGVHPLSHDQVVRFMRGNKTEPGHELVTRYMFSSLNKILWQRTPDAGVSQFWYNDKTQLRLSQNAQQRIDQNYSYSKYDAQGRAIEVGELNTVAPQVSVLLQLHETDFPTSGLSDFTIADVTRTYYDFGKTLHQQEFKQEYLRTRIAYVEVIQKGHMDTLNTYYTYDVHGNVKALIQHLPNLGYKRTDYVYDLISGKVNYVMYQYGKFDEYIHRYTYDADNRIQDLYTSSDGFIWDRDATYFYYLHGPLARVELGEYRVQGLDYYYSLQGWIKGVNMPYASDPGNDGYNGSIVGRDAFAFTLGYHYGDYKPINSSAIVSDNRDQLWVRYDESMGNIGLYNGNISWMITDLKKIGQVKAARAKGMQAMVYQYDQLHRIVQSRSLTKYMPSGGFAAHTDVSEYDEDYTYDPNGNVMTLKRFDENAELKDDFNYQYYNKTNRLRSVRPINKNKTIDGGEVTTDNIVYQNVTIKGNAFIPAGKKVEVKALEKIYLDPDFETHDNSDFWAHLVDDEGTYQYDAIGNLILNQDEGVQISWTPNGKVRDVRVKGDSLVVYYMYDATGNRVKKKIKTLLHETITSYVRDASGTVMTIYKDTTAIEQPLYGSDRIGMYRGAKKVGERTLGKKAYELSNHLSNVLSVISDNVNITSDSTWTNVLSASDYYPFGLTMEARNLSDTTYRYGFNGKEKDNKGEWGSIAYDYGFRIYDPKIGKFLSIDPLTQSYPWYTPYQYAGNSPIVNIDLDGLEKVSTNHYLHMTGMSPKLKKSEWYVIDGMVDPRTFSAAAKHNIAKNNPGAYQDIEDRHNWYKWASNETKSKSNYWFGAARDVTSKTMVGGADEMNLGFMTDEEERVLRGANEFLLQENFKNFGKYALNEGPVMWKGNDYSNMSGADLDNQMVVIEMSSLQGYLNTYRDDYIEVNGESAWNELHKGLNALFANDVLRPLTPASNKYAYEKFKEKYGQDAEFDFMNLEHRIFQGQKMAEYLRITESSEKKTK